MIREELEGHREFFYPPKGPSLIQTRRGQPVEAHRVQVEVAEIPYVRLREKLFGSKSSPMAGFDQLIAHAQHTLDLLPNLAMLLIVPTARRIYIGEIEIALRPVELVLYAHLASSRIKPAAGGKGFLSLDEIDGRREELLQRYERLYGMYSGRVDALRKKWATGIPRDSVRSHFANINRKIREVVPDRSQAQFYMVDSEGGYGATCYGLRLPPEKIEIREE